MGNFPGDYDDDASLSHVVDDVDKRLAKHHNDLKDAIKNMQNWPRHEADAVMFKKGVDVVAANSDGVEIVARDSDASVVGQAALDHITTLGGGVLSIGGGAYLLKTSKWLWNETDLPLTILGAGIQNTIITYKDSASGPAIHAQGAGVGASQAWFRANGFTVNQNVAGPTVDGILLENVQDPLLSNIELRGLSGAGLKLGGANGGQDKGLYMQIKSHLNATGLQIDAGTNSGDKPVNEQTFIQCRFQDNTAWGIDSQGHSNRFSFFGGSASDNAEGNIRVRGDTVGGLTADKVRSWSFRDFWIEATSGVDLTNPDKAHVVLDAETANQFLKFLFENCFFSGVGAHQAVNAAGVEALVLRGGLIDQDADATAGVETDAACRATRIEDVIRVGTDSGHLLQGVGETINGIGSESAGAETPTAADWRPGDLVDFEDTVDDSGSGLYVLLPDGVTWKKLAA